MRDEDERQVTFGWSGVRPLQRARSSEPDQAESKPRPRRPPAPGAHAGPGGRIAPPVSSGGSEAFLLTIAEVAEQYLRTTPKAVRRLLERGRLPGVVRVGRRVLFRRDRLLQFLEESSVSSPGETRR